LADDEGHIDSRRAYGDRLDALDPPLWACDSPANRLAVERRRAADSDPSGVTLFRGIGESHDEGCADLVPTIDEHHPGWTEIAVSATPGMRARFAAFGPGELLESGDGFRFVRFATS
jgi:hypothetical protein